MSGLIAKPKAVITFRHDFIVCLTVLLGNKRQGQTAKLMFFLIIGKISYPIEPVSPFPDLQDTYRG